VKICVLTFPSSLFHNFSCRLMVLFMRHILSMIKSTTPIGFPTLFLRKMQLLLSRDSQLLMSVFQNRILDKWSSDVEITVDEAHSILEAVYIFWKFDNILLQILKNDAKGEHSIKKIKQEIMVHIIGGFKVVASWLACQLASCLACFFWQANLPACRQVKLFYTPLSTFIIFFHSLIQGSIAEQLAKWQASWVASTLSPA
jgi:hypothetical protein